MLYLQGVIQNLHFYQYLMIATMHHTCSEPDLLTSVFTYGEVTGFLGSLKISPCEERRLKDTENPICEDRRFQSCLDLMPADSVTKPTKPED